MQRRYKYIILIGLSLLILPACSTHGTKQSEAVSTAQSVETDYFEDWMAIYRKGTGLIPDTKHLLDSVSVNSPEMFESLLRKIADRLCADSKANIAAVVVGYVYGIDMSPDQYSEIANRLLIQTRLPDTAAPAIEGLESRQGAMLVVFYESTCSNCHVVLDELKANYQALQGKGINIVSISSDSDPETFRRHAAALPWKDKLCDYKGFSGSNFRNWGVAATPVMYLATADGRVDNRYGSLEETGLLR